MVSEVANPNAARDPDVRRPRRSVTIQHPRGDQHLDQDNDSVSDDEPPPYTEVDPVSRNPPRYISRRPAHGNHQRANNGGSTSTRRRRPAPDYRQAAENIRDLLGPRPAPDNRQRENRGASPARQAAPAPVKRQRDEDRGRARTRQEGAAARSTSTPVVPAAPVGGNNPISPTNTDQQQAECQVCYTDGPWRKMLKCNGFDAHPFCQTCVVKAVETQIGMNKADLKCMSSDGCDYEFRPSKLQRFVGNALYERFMQIKQQQELLVADIEGLHACPFCDFKAIAPPIEEESQFTCLNPSCKKVSCRKCKRESHKPKTCEEMDEDKKLGKAHRVEEAMSEAVIRHCPRCNAAMLKTFGCNKMTCPTCRQGMCYLCKKPIRGYDHFAPEGRCPLNDRVDADDRHDFEARQAREEALRDGGGDNPEAEEDDDNSQNPERYQRPRTRRSDTINDFRTGFRTAANSFNRAAGGGRYVVQAGPRMGYPAIVRGPPNPNPYAAGAGPQVRWGGPQFQTPPAQRRRRRYG